MAADIKRIASLARIQRFCDTDGPVARFGTPAISSKR